MSVGNCCLIEALLTFFEMDNVNKSPKLYDPYPSNELSDDEKKAHVISVLDKLIDEYIFPTHSDDECMSSDDDMPDGCRTIL